MRIALLTALMMVTAMAWADEPSAPPDTKTEAAAPTKPAEQPAATSEATTAAVAPADDGKKSLRPPAGYRPKRVNGEQVWCAKLVVLGSRFPKEDCRNEAELRELIRIRESMRTDMEQRTKTCTSAGGCAWN
ncbi:MAG TPA: hypothetical protein VGQ22_04670 [Steroidobacteraceae bacterium]|jgi:hypothetical protein|nr:hypothetical protein [Steroidobacteraceae bacterium]